MIRVGITVPNVGITRIKHIAIQKKDQIRLSRKAGNHNSVYFAAIVIHLIDLTLCILFQLPDKLWLI